MKKIANDTIIIFSVILIGFVMVLSLVTKITLSLTIGWVNTYPYNIYHNNNPSKKEKDLQEKNKIRNF